MATNLTSWLVDIFNGVNDSESQATSSQGANGAWITKAINAIINAWTNDLPKLEYDTYAAETSSFTFDTASHHNSIVRLIPSSAMTITLDNSPNKDVRFVGKLETAQTVSFSAFNTSIEAVGTSISTQWAAFSAHYDETRNVWSIFGRLDES